MLKYLVHFLGGKGVETSIFSFSLLKDFRKKMESEKRSIVNIFADMD